MNNVHYRKEGSTELEEFTIQAGSPAAAVDLTNATTIVWNQKLVGGASALVDGGTVAKKTAPGADGVCTFDPLHAGGSGIHAFGTVGKYQVVVKITWSDGDVTYHPDRGYLIYDVQDNLE